MEETNKIEAISFNEALENAKGQIIYNIPSFVIQIINEMITDKIYQMVVDDNISNIIRFEIGQDDLVEAILKKVAEMFSHEFPEYEQFNRNMIFNNHWLDFEVLYRKKGWRVTYQKVLLSCECNSKYWIFEFNKTN